VPEPTFAARATSRATAKLIGDCCRVGPYDVTADGDARSPPSTAEIRGLVAVETSVSFVCAQPLPKQPFSHRPPITSDSILDAFLKIAPQMSRCIFLVHNLPVSTLA
jgi:hypothetical protein